MLHEEIHPLLLCNVWDVGSAKLAEKLGFKAIGTSSAAIAAMLGYADGEEMSFRELFFVVERIVEHTSLPLSVDIEGGYSEKPEMVLEHIFSLSKLGVVGVNIEDSRVFGKRQLLDKRDFAGMLEGVCQGVKSAFKAPFFINVRTDAFMTQHPNPVAETIERASLYQSVGANGLFVPGIEKTEDIHAVVQATALPVNVMCMPNLPDFKTLKALGVKRISMGNFLFERLNQHLEQSLKSILQSNSFEPIFEV